MQLPGSMGDASACTLARRARVTMLQLGNIPSNVDSAALVSFAQAEICATVAAQPAVGPQDEAPPSAAPNAPASGLKSAQVS